MAIICLYRGSMYSQGAQQHKFARVISVLVGFGLRGFEDMAARSAPRSTWNPGHIRVTDGVPCACQDIQVRFLPVPKVSALCQNSYTPATFLFSVNLTFPL